MMVYHIQYTLNWYIQLKKGSVPMIREARSSDVEQIAEVHVASWRTTYKGIISEQFLRKLSVERKID